ncbi:hypothetical protein [Haloarcula litorea]|uniref:hypothetical protein n=1 Tax=Haloarcula litorea TaxID=3032579 RepID=UPI0023E85153|nr:hypothetical protein [Halomicroarcula sp. GDY20]
MTEEQQTFDALVLASLAGVVGSKYLLGGALAVMTGSVNGSTLVLGSVPLTLVVGVALAVVAGGFVDRASWARALGLLTFLTVVGLSVPAVLAPDLVITVEAFGLVLAASYLLVRNPVASGDDPEIDEDDSAHRVGSTLR